MGVTNRESMPATTWVAIKFFCVRRTTIGNVSTEFEGKENAQTAVPNSVAMMLEVCGG